MGYKYPLNKKRPHRGHILREITGLVADFYVKNIGYGIKSVSVNKVKSAEV